MMNSKKVFLSLQNRILLRYVAEVIATILIAAAPVVVVGYRIVTLPPMWALQPDSTYGYLLAGTLLVQGQDPFFTFHPGTSLQWVSGLTGWILHAFGSTNFTFSEDTIARPEHFMQASNWVVGTLYCLSLVALFIQVRKHLGVAPFIAAASISLGGTSLTLPWAVILMPETLVLTCATMLFAVLVPRLKDRNYLLKPTTIVLIGFLVAMGICAKVTFLPVLFLLPFVLRLKEIVRAAAASIVFCLLILLPVRTHWMSIAHQLISQSNSNSRWGGSTGIDFAVTLQSLKSGIFELNGYLLGWSVAVGLGLAGVAFRMIHLPSRERMNASLPFIGLLAATVGTLFLAYKDYALRDFVVLSPLVATEVGLMTYFIMRSPTTTLRRIYCYGLVTLVVVMACLAVVRDSSNWNGEKRNIEEYAAEIESTIPRPDGTNYAIAELVRTPQAALVWGNEASGMQLGPLIADEYPNFIPFHPWSQTFSSWTSTDGLPNPLDCETLEMAVDRAPITLFISDFALDMIPSTGSDHYLLGDGATVHVGHQRRLPGALEGVNELRVLDVQCR